MSQPKPLKKPWFHILLALAEADLHGSAIAREVERLSQDRIKLWPVSLYGSLQAMCDAGLIVELTGSKGRPEGESERRRYYRITRSGRRALTEEARIMADLADRALARATSPGRSS